MKLKITQSSSGAKPNAGIKYQNVLYGAELYLWAGAVGLSLYVALLPELLRAGFQRANTQEICWLSTIPKCR